MNTTPHHPEPNASRRQILRTGLLAAAGAALSACTAARPDPRGPASSKTFTISLAQWSLHRALQSGSMDALDFAKAARRDYGIDAIEYVNSFYKARLPDSHAVPTLAREMRSRCSGEGVKSVLIMCDGEGELGNPDDTARAKAVDNHKKWAELAAALGCHSIRVNAASRGTPEEQMKLAADGLRRLTEFCASHDLNCIVENHGGLSSHGDWLVGVMKLVNHPRVGTLPDFGNFYEYDRYQGVTDMMPYARGVSAKSHDFDPVTGNETHTDYDRMMRIVLAAGYHGRLGIEYEGEKLSEPEGIRATHRLLLRIQASLKAV